MSPITSSRWLELRSRSFFWEGAVSQTNVGGLGSIHLRYSRQKKLFVQWKGKPFLETDGERLLSVEGTVFEPRDSWQRPKLLASREFSLLLNWSLPPVSGKFCVGVGTSRSADEQYRIAHDTSQLVRWGTKVRVESSTRPFDERVMAICGCYFWARFESDRTYY
jgi:hypothetical protein